MSRYQVDPYVQMPATNSMGTAGFVCSLIGLFTGGILSPIGLILSLIGLGRQPRGLAIAGVILGFLGTCGGLLILIVLLVGVAAFAAVFGVLILSNPEKLEVTSDMVNIAVAVEKYRDENHYLPAGLGLLGLSEPILSDPWGTEYKYVQDDPQTKYDIISAGVDKKFDTPDDVSLNNLGKVWGADGAIQIEGTDSSGKVEIKVGEKKIKIEGDEHGGSVQINPPATSPQ